MEISLHHNKKKTNKQTKTKSLSRFCHFFKNSMRFDFLMRSKQLKNFICKDGSGAFCWCKKLVCQLSLWVVSFRGLLCAELRLETVWLSWKMLWISKNLCLYRTRCSRYFCIIWCNCMSSPWNGRHFKDESLSPLTPKKVVDIVSEDLE